MLTIFASTHFNDPFPSQEDLRSKLISTGNRDLLKIWDRPLIDCIEEGCLCDILASIDRYFSIYAWGILKEIEPDAEWYIFTEKLAIENSLARSIEMLDVRHMYISNDNFPLMYSERILEKVAA